jgi:hypothetical protein
MYAYLSLVFCALINGLRIVFHSTPRPPLADTFDTTTYWYFSGSVFALLIMTMIIPEFTGLFRGAGSSFTGLGKAKPLSVYQKNLQDGLKFQNQAEFLKQLGK